jgi:anti-sigma regulatory factor (Ser/Thr protein kinase)
MTTPSAKHVWPATVESVVPARDEVMRFARATGASRRALDDIKLATSEACTNAVLHAYAPERSDAPTFLVSFESRAGEIIVWVRDHGSGLTPTAKSPGLGIGLALISELTRAFAITTPDGGGTQLRMCFSIDAAAKDSPKLASRGISPIRAPARA